MHRVLDLAILLCRTNLYFRDEAYRHPRYYDPEHPRIDRVGLQGDAMDIEVCTENPMLEEDIRLFYNVLGEDGELLGYVEGSPETWNRRFRISNLCIFEDAGRRRGIGTALMDTIAKAADASGVRMLVLETQSCNERAIAFYRKNGFSVIGFDLYAYSNRDPERHEVRVEMGKRLDQAGISG